VRLRVLLAATVTVLAATVASAAPAAATSYRYWTYWHGQGSSWTFSSYGPAARPADGAVEGWRFEVSVATGSSTPPRAAPSFATICDTTPAVADRKRVVFLTVKVPRAWESYNNRMLEANVKRYPNAVLVDWRVDSLSHPEWFWGDAIHLREDGARVFARLIADAVFAP